MTRNQFDDWLEHHVAHFPGVATWLGKFGDVQKAAILKVWYEHLKGCELADCWEATVSLYTVGEGAAVYERHPQAIRAIVHNVEVADISQDPAAELREEVAEMEAELLEHPWKPISQEIREAMK